MPSINDNFADAIEVTIATNGGTYTSPSLNTNGNTTEPGEPHVTASSNVSAWWKYTPASSGTASIDTQLSTSNGGSTDSFVAVWTGTNFGDMVLVASDDDSGGSGKSLISSLSVTAGTTHWVQVAGFGFATMNVVLRVTGPASAGGGGGTAPVTATRSTTWRTRATVTTARATSWTTRTTVTQSRATSWDTRAITTPATRSTSWDTAATISRALATTWDVRRDVTAQRSSSWNVDSTIVAVTATRATSWRTLASPSSTRVTSWTVRAEVAATRPTGWDVHTSTGRTVATTWRTLAPAAQARVASWRILAAAIATRATTWDTLSERPDPAPPRLRVAPSRPARYAAASTRPMAGLTTTGARAPRYRTGGPS